MADQPENTVHWIIQGKAPIGKGRWSVMCRSCQTVSIMSASQIRRNNPACGCKKVHKSANLYEYQGLRLPLTMWARRYPGVVNLGSARVRAHQRKNQGVKMSDEEVIFGLTRNSEDYDAPIDTDKNLLSRVPVEVVNAMQTKLTRLLESVLADQLAPILLQNQRRDTSTIPVAGSNYILESQGGFTIHDYLAAGLPIGEIVAVLRMETFPSAYAKYERLKEFIAIEPPEGQVDSTVLLTLSEIQQLLSYASVELLASLEANPV